MAKGAQIAVLQGDPTATGVYTIRLKLPEGYVIPPHFHPADEQVTVISGHFLLGMGDTVDRFKARRLSPGDYATAPAETHHYAIAADQVVVQVHGAGPFLITYVNAGDDPRSVLARQ
jgi:quercetin dioxygenase-like cupin family protein